LHGHAVAVDGKESERLHLFALQEIGKGDLAIYGKDERLSNGHKVPRLFGSELNYKTARILALRRKQVLEALVGARPVYSHRNPFQREGVAGRINNVEISFKPSPLRFQQIAAVPVGEIHPLPQLGLLKV